jgi:hypothetical protein
MSVADRMRGLMRRRPGYRVSVLGVALVAACSVGCAGTPAQPPPCRGQSVPINAPARAVVVAAPVTAAAFEGAAGGQ